MKIYDVLGRPAVEIDTDVEGRPIPRNFDGRNIRCPGARRSPFPRCYQVVMDLPALDDWTPAQNDKVVNVHWAGALRAHRLGSVVSLVPAAGDEPIERGEGPRVMAMRLLGVDFLQTQYIRRSPLEQGPQDRGPAIEERLLA